MKTPEYVTKEEVKRVCRELGIRDWAELSDATIMPDEAKVILAEVNTKQMNIPLQDFLQGLEVELEHGTRFDDANITNNHPLLTGKIVLAHLKETLDYYRRIDVAEIEGDLLKALAEKDANRAKEKYRKLIDAKRALNEVEAARLQESI